MEAELSAKVKQKSAFNNGQLVADRASCRKIEPAQKMETERRPFHTAVCVCVCVLKRCWIEGLVEC